MNGLCPYQVPLDLSSTSKLAPIISSTVQLPRRFVAIDFCKKDYHICFQKLSPKVDKRDNDAVMIESAALTMSGDAFVASSRVLNYLVRLHLAI